MTTRDRLRPAVLARRVLLPPVLAGGALACLLAALAVTAAGGARAHEGNPLAPAAGHARLVVALSTDVEGTPGPRDVRRARRPLPARLRLLQRHPYFRLYTRAQRRFHVPWVLVASVHYQETGFEPASSRSVAGARRRTAAAAVMVIAAQLRAAGSPRNIGPGAVPALVSRYGASAEGRVSAAMVIERARAWRLLGTIPTPGTGELSRPVAGVTGGCGYFGCPRPGHLHNGVDFLAPRGTPVHAVDRATVALVQAPGESGGYGNFVCLQHRPHLASCYAHLSAVAAGIRVGARVRRGDVVGLVGSTGSSTTPHLHFELRVGPAECQSCAIDPLPLLSGEVPQRSVPKMLRATATTLSGGADGGSGGRAPAPPPTAPAATPAASRRSSPGTPAAPGSGGATAGDPSPGPPQAKTPGPPTGGAAPTPADPPAAPAPAPQDASQVPAATTPAQTQTQTQTPTPPQTPAPARTQTPAPTQTPALTQTLTPTDP